jgi:ATP:corrinoid adenosyltransferase
MTALFKEKGTRRGVVLTGRDSREEELFDAAEAHSHSKG